MKLYKVPRNTRIRFNNREYDFHHIDGMYSYCVDDAGNVIHLSAWEDVEVVNELLSQ